LGLLSKANDAPPTGDRGLEGRINLSRQIYPFFHGIVLEKGQFDEVGKTLSLCGTVCSLSEERVLALLPGRLDKELIAHRLKNSLHCEVPLLFDATSTEEALGFLAPFIDASQS
jgi:hypothetical protein